MSPLRDRLPLATESWMKNNLEEAKGAPKPEEINARWTFGGKWDPEAKIKSLWNVLAY